MQVKLTTRWLWSDQEPISREDLRKKRSQDISQGVWNPDTNADVQRLDTYPPQQRHFLWRYTVHILDSTLHPDCQHREGQDRYSMWETLRRQYRKCKKETCFVYMFCFVLLENLRNLVKFKETGQTWMVSHWWQYSSNHSSGTSLFSVRKTGFINTTVSTKRQLFYWKKRYTGQKGEITDIIVTKSPFTSTDSWRTKLLTPLSTEVFTSKDKFPVSPLTMAVLS